MKRILAIVMVCTLLFCGCATLQNWFCSPTTIEIAQATENLTKAQELQIFLATMPSSPEIAAWLTALQIAIPILDKVRQGLCVAVGELTNAITVASKTETAAAMKFGYKRK